MERLNAQAARDALGHAREVVSFLAVGGGAAVAFTALGSLLTQAGVRPSLSLIGALAVVVLPSYFAQRRLTFRSARPHRDALPRYLLTQMVGNGLGLIVAEAVPSVIRDRPALSFALLAVGIAMTNFAMLKLWTFRKPQGGD